jgi:hypothetical protein
MERNAMQMVEVLMARLKNLEGKVIERQRAAGEDRNPDSGLCSSLVPALVADLSDDEDDGEKSSNKYSVFRPRPSSRTGGPSGRNSIRVNSQGSSSAGGGGQPSPVNEVFVTFRSEPSTEFGKRLEHKFEVELLGKGAAGLVPPGSGGSQGSGGMDMSAGTPGRAVTFGVQQTQQQQVMGGLTVDVSGGMGGGGCGGGAGGTPPNGEKRRQSRVGTRKRGEQKKIDELKVIGNS